MKELNTTPVAPFVVTVLSTRGGVTKSTNAANISAFCADHGLKVLMIDTDVQPSLFTKGLNLKDKNIRDIANAYGWDENMLKKVDAWSQVGANIAAGWAGYKVAKCALDKPSVIPREANANSKLPLVGKSKGYENQTETYFRVEDGGVGYKTSKNRITVNQDGSVSINSGCQGQLCVSTGSSNHAMYYLTEKRPNGTVVVFGVDKRLHDDIIFSAVPQRLIPGIARDPNSPKIVDDGKGKLSINLELPKVWDRLIEKHSSNGRVLTEQEFKNEFGN